VPPCRSSPSPGRSKSGSTACRPSSPGSRCNPWHSVSIGPDLRGVRRARCVCMANYKLLKDFAIRQAGSCRPSMSRIERAGSTIEAAHPAKAPETRNAAACLARLSARTVVRGDGAEPSAGSASLSRMRASPHWMDDEKSRRKVQNVRADSPGGMRRRNFSRRMRLGCRVGRITGGQKWKSQRK